MAQLPSAFNPSAPGQEGVGQFKAIPPGDYHAHIVESSMKDTKNKNGQYLELVWQILSGEHVDRKLWTRLNLVNPSQQAVEIAQKHLKSVCDAIGVPGPISDSNVLHGRACTIKVVKTAATAQYGEGNEVKNYMPLDGIAIPGTMEAPGTPMAAPSVPNVPVVPETPAATPPAAPPATTAGKPPWLK